MGGPHGLHVKEAWHRCAKRITVERFSSIRLSSRPEAVGPAIVRSDLLELGIFAVHNDDIVHPCLHTQEGEEQTLTCLS